MELSDERSLELREYHRQLLAYLNIQPGAKLTYDDAMWLMMWAAENALDNTPADELTETEQ